MYLDDLNPKQREAAEATAGPVMILAGAGAGKTKTLTYRIIRLIEEGVPADAILAVTFTNKAAGEMRERVVTLLETLPEAQQHLSAGADPGRLPTVATFHALGVRILREHATLIGLPRSFAIWDRADQMRAVKEALVARGLEKQYEPKHVLGRISKEKGDGVTRDLFLERIHTPWEQAVAEAWLDYERALAEEHALDFDDLLLKTLFLLRQHPDVRARYQARWTHLMVDEYQDTNGVQYAIMRELIDPANNVCVVGDVDQNIYSWRGADIAHLLRFEKDFPGATVILLEQNYRSTKTIIQAANDIIARNKNRFEKHLFTENAHGEPITIYHAFGEGDEARWVARRIAAEIERGTKPESIAVLYRANFQSRALEEALLQSGVPYRVLGTRFFDRAEIRDMLGYLRAAMNPRSRSDLARIIGTPPRGIGKATFAYLLEDRLDELKPAARKKVDAFLALLARIREAAETRPVSEALRLILSESGLETHLYGEGEEGRERIENIKELVSLATRYDELPAPEGAERLIEDAALATDQDSLAQGGGVSLMTVHASKGLEFDAVVITGLEDGLFPHEKFDEEADDEEERRLFYVAVTRARQRLYLAHAATRMMYGTREITSPSPFLADLALELTRHEHAAERTAVATPPARKWWEEELEEESDPDSFSIE
ncbi:MAG TPA: UvrD-helicase domain-containing protein [Candidatus Paceibacterota bacterium]|nr:UvrD-helicase domain-containing protein [Candidatus Paceibacterota bacterium]